MTIPCEQCGTEFQRPGSRGTVPRFCSARCRNAAARRRAGKGVTTTIACERCGSTIVHPAGSRGRKPKYCSRACEGQAARRRTGQVRDGSPQTCSSCGTEIDQTVRGQGGGTRQRYCSRACRAKAAYRRAREDPAAAARLQEYHRAYRQANVERRREWARAARARNLQQYREYYRNWLDQPGNYEHKLASNHSRRVQQRGSVDSVGVSQRDWQRLVGRYRGCCAYCGVPTPAPQMDHVVPISRGGRHAIGNVLPACGPCNVTKHSRLLVEWRFRQRRLGAPLSARS